MKIERNPMKIIWIARKDLLVKGIWRLYFFIILLLWILDNLVPNQIIIVNYDAFSVNQFLLLSISALTFILSMFMFGKEVYEKEDFATFLKENQKVYYEYLAGYLFPSFLWSGVLVLSVNHK